MSIHTINKINRKFLTHLTEDDCDACISLYMPVIQAGADTRKNSIVFKDLKNRSREKLEKYGIGNSDIEKLLKPLKSIEDDKMFWDRRPHGLAIFISPKHQVIYRSAVAFPVEAIVDKRFYIRPLLPLIQQDEIDIVLLGRKNIQLAHCDGNECKRILPPNELQTLDAFLSHHDFEESLQHASSSMAPHMHGHGTAGDKATENRYLHDYFRSFKNWLQDQIPNDQEFYLAGDEDSIGLFMKVAEDVPGTAVPLIRKNIQSLDDKELLDEVKAELARHAAEKNSRAFEEFLRTRSNEPDKTVENSAEKIVAAAHACQIQTLFLPPEEEKIWGHFDPANQNITVEGKPEEGVGEELFNLAAIRTLRSGGSVLVNDSQEIIKNAAAICYW